MRWMALLLLAGCGPHWVEDRVDGFRRLVATVRTGPDGQRTLRFDPEPGETAVLLSAVATEGLRTHVVQVLVEGEVAFDAVEEATGDRASTNAGYLAPVATLNWPRGPQEALGPVGITVGSVGADDQYTRGRVEVRALFKADPDLQQGRLPITLVFAGGAADDPALADAVDQAVAHWRELYDAVGIALEVDQTTWPEGELDPPVLGTEAEYVAIHDAVGAQGLNVVIAPAIAGVEGVLGIAGDIPGPLEATTRSAVLVSALTSAGPDGRFNAEEIRILGETMAHEAGHYLGLFHPVETTWDRWDAIDDTEECGGEQSCANKLADLLMFPFPVCGFATCTAQEVITDGQAAVMHRYVGVR